MEKDIKRLNGVKAHFTLKQDIVEKLLNGAQLFDRTVGEVFSSYGVDSVQQLFLLEKIKTNPGISAKELQSITVFTKQNLSGLLNRMSKKQLIETKQSEKDKRMIENYLTNEGEKVLEKVMPFKQVMLNEYLQDFKMEELVLFDLLLERFITTMEQDNERPSKLYLHEIREYPLLTEEKEELLFEQVKAGDDQAKKRIIESNLRLVSLIAKTYKMHNRNLSDVIKAGNVGLLKAFDTYHPQRNGQFSMYASEEIKKEIECFLKE